MTSLENTEMEDRRTRDELSVADTAKVAILEVNISFMRDMVKEIRDDIKNIQNQFVTISQHANDKAFLLEKFNEYVTMRDFTRVKDQITALLNILKWILGLITLACGTIVVYYINQFFNSIHR